MIFFENIILALNGLWANKMRSLLTMLGIIIGIGSVIAIMTVGDSLTLYVSDQMQSMGASNIQVVLQPRSEEEEDNGLGLMFGMVSSNEAVTDDDLITSKLIDSYYEQYKDKIYAISVGNSLGDSQINIGKDYANVSITGVNTGFLVASDLELLAGNYFTTRDFKEGRNVALISDKTVKNIFDGDNEKAIGQEIEIEVNGKALKYTVMGIYKYEAQTMAETMMSDQALSTSMYVPLISVNNITHSKGYQYFSVIVNSDINTDDFLSETERFFEGYYRNNRSFEVSAFTLESMVSMMSEMMSTITLAVSIVAGIALLVGGIGVMNIMLVSITERTREIGTRKALGATNASIRIQFIVEAVIICLIGGVLGIITGILMGELGASLMGYPAVPSLKSIIISITFSMATGVFFGYYPANKAAKMNPIDALRYE